MTAPLIYFVAGEASGDQLGGGLMQALRAQNPDIRFAGIGGEVMQREGLASLFPYSRLSIMGFAEVVPRIPAMLRYLREAALDIAQKKPDAVVTIDSPGFNFRLARILKNTAATQHIKRIHYVAPSVWAYKPERARKTAELFDGLLTLFSFEPPYFEKEGLPTVCVGHPLLWEPCKGDGAAFRTRHNIGANTPLLLVLPGSRPGEVKRLLPLFLKVAEEFPSFTVAVLASPQVKEMIAALSPAPALVIDVTEKQDAFAAATLALSKSGTITLELAAAGVPMVIAYKVNPLSAWLMRRMVLIKYASLVNIAADKEIVPELLQERCNAYEIAKALHQLLPLEARERQRKECAEALSMLKGNNKENPNVTAAEAVLKYLG